MESMIIQSPHHVQNMEGDPSTLPSSLTMHEIQDMFSETSPFVFDEDRTRQSLNDALSLCRLSGATICSHAQIQNYRYTFDVFQIQKRELVKRFAEQKGFVQAAEAEIWKYKQMEQAWRERERDEREMRTEEHRKHKKEMEQLEDKMKQGMKKLQDEKQDLQESCDRITTENDRLDHSLDEAAIRFRKLTKKHDALIKKEIETNKIMETLEQQNRQLEQDLVKAKRGSSDRPKETYLDQANQTDDVESKEAIQEPVKEATATGADVQESTRQVDQSLDDEQTQIANLMQQLPRDAAEAEAEIATNLMEEPRTELHLPLNSLVNVNYSITTFEEQHKQIQGDLNDREDTLTSWVPTLTDSQQAVQQSEQLFDDERAKISTLQEQTSTPAVATASIEELQGQIATLNEQLNAVIATTTGMEDLRRQLDVMRSSQEDLQRVTEQSEKRLGDQQVLVAALQEQLNASVVATAEMDELRTELCHTQTSLADAHNTNATLRLELAQAQAQEGLRDQEHLRTTERVVTPADEVDSLSDIPTQRHVDLELADLPQKRLSNSEPEQHDFGFIATGPQSSVEMSQEILRRFPHDRRRGSRRHPDRTRLQVSRKAGDNSTSWSIIRSWL